MMLSAGYENHWLQARLSPGRLHGERGERPLGTRLATLGRSWDLTGPAPLGYHGYGLPGHGALRRFQEPAGMISAELTEPLAETR